MSFRMKRSMLNLIPFHSTKTVGNRVLWLLTRRLRKEFLDHMTGKFVEVLLKGMDTMFCLDSDYRKDNIQNFTGRYLFQTKDEVIASATFKGGDMKVSDGAAEGWNVRVTFEDSDAVRKFIFSKDQDILESLLNNEVEVDGNLNYIYKFGFMARDLGHRLGVA